MILYNLILYLAKYTYNTDIVINIKSFTLKNENKLYPKKSKVVFIPIKILIFCNFISAKIYILQTINFFSFFKPLLLTIVSSLLLEEYRFLFKNGRKLVTMKQLTVPETILYFFFCLRYEL